MASWPERIEQIEADSAAIAALLPGGGISRSVDHCAGWTVDEVVTHLGGVHRWATNIVRTGAAAASQVSSRPDPADDLGPWLREGADALVGLLRRTDPARACWTFGRPPSVVGFWRRRQILETAVHRTDVEIAPGLPPSLAVELAETGLDEVVDFLYPRQVALRRTPALGQAVTLSGSDRGRSWTVGTGTTVAEISGTEPDLLLMVWGRPHGDVTVVGDSVAIEAFRAAALVP